MTSSIRFFVHETQEATVKAATDRLLNWIDEVPKINLALATGKTMIPLYQ
jgi:6-phosphogluconolactonase/glucosamine-6-phosphate isomerase/deaminase